MKRLKRSCFVLAICIGLTIGITFILQNPYFTGRIYDNKALLLLKLSKGLQLKQIVTVAVMYIWGNLMLHIIQKDADERKLAIYAFPFSVACWCVGSLFVLIIGIPYTLLTMLLLGGAILIAGILLRRLRITKEMLAAKGTYFNWFLGGVCLLSIGLVFVSALSDVFYYNYQYGKELAIVGHFDKELMLYPLTRGGQMSALLSSLAYFCGFDNINTINHVMMLNMVVLMCVTVCGYHKKKAIGLIAVLFSMTPYILMAGMVSNNSMEMFAMTILALCVYQKGRDGQNDAVLYSLCILFSMMTTMGRIEGGIYVTFIAVCTAMLRWERGEILKYLCLPALGVQILYYIKLFGVIGVEFDSQFVTKGNLIINIGILLCGILYVVIIYHPALKKIKEHIGEWILLGSFGINLAEILLDSDKYFYNIRIIIDNIMKNDKDWQFCVWGITPWIAVLALLSVVVRGEGMRFLDVSWLSYILLCVGICWARETVLRDGFGDSANRMLMMILPIMAMALASNLATVVSVNREEIPPIKG